MSKTVRLAKRGEISKQNFVNESPFFYYKKLILIDVNIGGKDYKFIFDTGAYVNVIDESIIDEIPHKLISRHRVTSSGGESKKKQYIQIESILIDSIDFTNTGALVQDLSGINALLGCNKVDGIIGNSLLKLATWQIDYENETMTIASDISKIKTFSKPIEVSNKKYGVKRIELEIDGDKRNYIFDTGFNSFIQSNKFLKEQMKEQNDSINSVVLSRAVTANLFGKNVSETAYIKTKNLKFNNQEIKNQIVCTKEKSSSLLGNDFSDHFIITYDWVNSHIYFDQQKEFEDDSLFVYNEFFIPDYKVNKIIIVSKWNDNDSQLKVSDTVDSINGIDLTQLSKEELCAFWDVEWKEIKKGLEITVKVNGEVYSLKKKLILN